MAVRRKVEASTPGALAPPGFFSRLVQPCIVLQKKPRELEWGETGSSRLKGKRSSGFARCTVLGTGRADRPCADGRVPRRPRAPGPRADARRRVALAAINKAVWQRGRLRGKRKQIDIPPRRRTQTRWADAGRRRGPSRRLRTATRPALPACPPVRAAGSRAQQRHLLNAEPPPDRRWPFRLSLPRKAKH